VTGYRGKRQLDLAIAILALVVFGPLMLVLAAVIALRMGRPVLFTQQRPGLHEQPFKVYKFRSMTIAVDSDGRPLPDRDRLTQLGRFLRVSSLDELPGLFNVVRGDMSLVGPRPLLMKYLPYYSVRERTRANVRPGLTGWAQINGRNDLPWDNRLACDVWYVEHCSLALDLKILARTAYKVLKRSNIQVAGGEPDLSVERGGCMAQQWRGSS
jgi:lipopolysaccharide/colanic/teichoic acid biosynthesis glycosyltransferase